MLEAGACLLGQIYGVMTAQVAVSLATGRDEGPPSHPSWVLPSVCLSGSQSHVMDRKVGSGLRLWC